MFDKYFSRSTCKWFFLFKAVRPCIFRGTTGISLSYSYSELMLGPHGRSSGRNVYRGVVRTCQLSKYYGATQCVCASRLVWKIVCVCVTEREEGERAKGREGRRDKEKREKRAVIPLWPWLRFHWACGVSWPCLDFAQEQRPAQTSYTPHLYSQMDTVDRTARLTRSFVLSPNWMLAFLSLNWSFSLVPARASLQRVYPGFLWALEILENTWILFAKSLDFWMKCLKLLEKVIAVLK